MEEKDTLSMEELEAAAMAAVNNSTDEDTEIEVQTSAELTDADKLAQAEAEIAELKDKLLRAVADHTNYRKQMQKQMADLILNGGKKVIDAILPVLDDMERAQSSIAAIDPAADAQESIGAAREGLEMIFQKLNRTLELQGLKKMKTPTAKDAAESIAFDTDFHEAVAILPMGEDKKDKIIDTVQTGYMLNDKVLRHAKVVVGA